MNSNLATFWRFLSDHTVEIPIIQRDYAQGRQGKEELRKTFLKDLKHSLDSGEPLKLDFVYGAAERGAFTPLDGQQRLTTLWLLHWYLAYMAGKMDEGVRQVLAKFTYETRTSSREFCKRLSGFFERPSAESGVVDHIQNQTWFRSAWKQDPTIQSMLRMLGGTSCQGKDGIEGAFESTDGVSAYEKYWEKLSGGSCPIEFYALDIHGINQTDDLYIKMNARGKPLTSFENLKADLAGYISRQAAKGSNTEDSWKQLNNPENGLAIKMDTDWMNGIFWKNKSSDSAVDEIYFAFINRFFFNAYALTMTEVDDINVGADKVFDFLYGRNTSKKSADEKIVYLGFDSVYQKVIKEDAGILDRLAKTLDNFKKFSEMPELFGPPWGNGDFYFVPQYKKGWDGQDMPISDFAGNTIREIGSITQPHRVVFHAVCKFFEYEWNAENGKELLALKDWMRVVWNIVENANVDTIPGMIGCLKLIDELGSHSHNILEWLSRPEKALKSNFAKDQVAEEIEKARKILAGGVEWEKKIACAENYAFFHGAIRFLFLDETGKVKWDDFDVKWFNAQSYFDTNGVTEAFRRHSLLLRALLVKIDKSGGITEGFWFGNGANFWRNQVLLNAGVNSVVSELLLTEVTRDNAIPANTPAWIADDALISDAIAKDNDPNGQWHIIADWFRTGNADISLTRYSRRITGNVNHPRQIIPLCELLRNDLLEGMESDERRGKNYFIGWASNINFKYNGHCFRWYGTPQDGECDIIYLLKNDWQNDEDPYMRHNEDETKNGDQRSYYCFNVDECETDTTFKSKLDKLIASAQ